MRALKHKCFNISHSLFLTNTKQTVAENNKNGVKIPFFKTVLLHIAFIGNKTFTYFPKLCQESDKRFALHHSKRLETYCHILHPRSLLIDLRM